MPRPLVALIVALVALGAVAQAARAGELVGEWIVFHGWCPDSSCYAYTVAEIHTVRGRERRRDEHRLVRIRRGRSTRPQVRRYRSERAMFRAARSHLVSVTEPAVRPGDGTVVFPFQDGRRLVFRLAIGEQLGYTVTLEGEGEPTTLASGRYDDLYATTNAYGYLSPDRTKLALVVYGQTTPRVRGEVHFIRLPGPMAAAGSPPPEVEEPPLPIVEEPPAPAPAPRREPRFGIRKLGAAR